MTGRLYDRRAWRRLREQQLRQHPLCEDCLAAGITRVAVEVDHRIAIKDGGEPLDFVNLRSLCKACHSRKTAFIDSGFGNARKTRAPIKGASPDGRPLDPAHWWRK